MHNTTLMFLGTTACRFDKNNDTPSFIINGKYLFDTGFALVNNLKNNDINPLSITHIFFTHMHHDHYISLPALLFYYNHTGGNLENLTIVGPSEDIETITNSAINFINAGKWNYKRPKIVKLEDYGSYETDDMLFETVPAIHGVQGLCYRITDNQTGKVICATGDTTQNDRLPDFFKGCDLLIHEISLGMQEELGGAHNKYGHSTVQEAVTLANHTDAKELFFVHHSRNHEAAIMEYAQAHLIGQKSGWPQIGKLYSLS